MKHETSLDNDFVAVDEEQEPQVFKPRERMAAPRIVLEMPLPELRDTAHPDDPTEDLGERMNEWNREFKRAAECFLHEQGYANVKVTDFESLQYTEGYGKDDYLLKVTMGGDDKVGEESASSVPVIVRRIPKKRL